MLRVHSVSEIKIMLSGILRSHAELKDIEVCGKISQLKGAYFLSNGKVGIRCFITPTVKTQSASLLVSGTSVVVKGEITLYTDLGFNEYQIEVNKIARGADDVAAFNMNRMGTQLLEIVKNQLELIDVRAKGKVNYVKGMPKNVLSLKDPDGSAILCRFHNNQPPNQDGKEISIRGKISNFSAKNRIQYQVDVAEIEFFSPDDSEMYCQCLGCAQCEETPKCGRPREAANFESCAACLPRPPDELYELCSECYAVSPDRETKIANTVRDYLDRLGVSGFSSSTEWQIQFGTRNGIADVVLSDAGRSLAVIAECKGAGYVGHGVEQLKSYLSATDTRFGIFANRVDRDQWIFFKNQGQNRFDEIGLSEFEEEINKGVILHERRNEKVEKVDTLLAGLKHEVFGSDCGPRKQSRREKQNSILISKEKT